MAANQYLIERIVVDGTSIKGFTRYAVDPAIERVLGSGGSVLDPSQLAVTGVRPAFMGTTLDIGSLLGLVYGSSHAIPHSPIGSACDIWFQRAAAGGTQGGASSNIKAAMTKGLLVPLRLRNNGQRLAEADIAIYADFDGTNVPLVFTTAQSLPALTASSPALWTLRALKNGSAGSVLSHLTDIEIDFGVACGRPHPANSLYPTNGFVYGYNPRLQFGTTDLATALGASAFAGAVAASGGLIVYIAEWDDDGAGVKAAGALTLTFAAGSPWWSEGVSGERNAPIAIPYTCEGIGGATLVEASSPLRYSGAGVALPDEACTAAAWMLGPVYDNTTALELESASVRFGLGWQVTGPPTLPWRTHATLTRREPSFDLQLRDMEYVAGLGLAGRAVATVFKQYFRALSGESEPVIDATASHVKLSCAAGWICATGYGAGHNELLRPGLSVLPTGGLSVTTGTAIT